MADRPSITTFNSGGRYDTATLNSNFQAIRDAFDVLLGLNGTSGANNTLTGNVDAGNNRIINIAQLEAAALLLNSVNITSLFGNLNPRGDWATSTVYALRDIVYETDTVYICIEAHTSGTFSTDLAADKWMVFSNPTLDTSLPVPITDGGTGSTSASDARTALSLVPGTDVEVFNADILKADETDTLEVGYDVTPNDAGTVASGTLTPAFATRNVYEYVNGGAHTLAPPSSGSGSIVIQVTNNGSAGAVTTSGFTTVTGDALTTTNGDDFLLFITKVGSFSHLHVVALQ